MRLFTDSLRTKRAFSSTIAILFTFNTISWAAPIQQYTLRPISTGQKVKQALAQPSNDATFPSTSIAYEIGQVIKDLWAGAKQQPESGPKSSSAGDFELDSDIDLRHRVNQALSLQDFGMHFLSKFVVKFTNTASDTFKYLKMLDEVMVSLKKDGMHTADFGELSDWDRRLAAMSYYLYGEVLSETELVRRLEQKNEIDFYVLEQAGTAFATIAELMVTKGKLSLKELLQEYHTHVRDMREQFRHITILADGSDPAIADMSDVIRTNTDADFDLLKRALHICLGRLPLQNLSSPNVNAGPKDVTQFPSARPITQPNPNAILSISTSA